jgi:hypothetical protein
MTMLFRVGIAYAFCVCITGCAVPGASSDTTATATPIRATTISASNARDAITIGKSTKTDVMAALGKTTVISFDSGFEVWVYQVASDTTAKPGWAEFFGRAGSNKAPGKTEFVILFAPSGVVTKARIRAAPPPA